MGCGVVAALDQRSCSVSHELGPLPIVIEALNCRDIRINQLPIIAKIWNEKSGFPIPNRLRHPTYIRGDHRQTPTHRLEDNVRKTIESACIEQGIIAVWLQGSEFLKWPKIFKPGGVCKECWPIALLVRGSISAKA